jgi:hypothetical protein
MSCLEARREATERSYAMGAKRREVRPQMGPYKVKVKLRFLESERTGADKFCSGVAQGLSRGGAQPALADKVRLRPAQATSATVRGSADRFRDKPAMTGM